MMKNEKLFIEVKSNEISWVNVVSCRKVGKNTITSSQHSRQLSHFEKNYDSCIEASKHNQNENLTNKPSTTRTNSLRRKIRKKQLRRRKFVWTKFMFSIYFTFFCIFLFSSSFFDFYFAVVPVCVVFRDERLNNVVDTSVLKLWRAPTSTRSHTRTHITLKIKTKSFDANMSLSMLLLMQHKKNGNKSGKKEKDFQFHFDWFAKKANLLLCTSLTF